MTHPVICWQLITKLKPQQQEHSNSGGGGTRAVRRMRAIVGALAGEADPSSASLAMAQTNALYGGGGGASTRTGGRPCWPGRG